MMEFLHMGGYAGYVWSAYGIVAVVMFINAIAAWRRYKNVLLRLKRLHTGNAA
ncbi:MAG: heme exporter protein CcmD [Thiotrichales bacterium]|nr:heme exporter protein CcmD [Thiotrichales bacterium]